MFCKSVTISGNSPIINYFNISKHSLIISNVKSHASKKNIDIIYKSHWLESLHKISVSNYPIN